MLRSSTKDVINKFYFTINECLAIQPMYISGKFRNGKVYAINDQEKNIYNKLALEKLKTEMEELTNRRELFRNSIDTIDRETEQFQEILRREVLSEWVKEFQKDISLLQDLWKKKIEGTKKAFEKDKTLIQQKSNSNENKTNEENVSNTEGNDNDINEERRDTPNPWRHNSYNYNHYRSQSQSNRYNSKNYYHKPYPPRERKHLRFQISHLIIFQTFSCLHYAIA